MRYLLSILMVCLLLLLPSCKKGYKTGIFRGKARKETLLKARLDSIRIADSIKEVQLILDRIENEKVDSARKADQDRSARETVFRYKIIVGSFKVSDNAENLAEIYRKKGFDATVIKHEDSGNNLVAAGAYDKLSTAVEHLEEFRKSIFENAL